MSMEPQPPSLPVQIGSYRVVRSLGKGGMGEVFLAFDPKCERNVALKQIRQEMSDNTTLQERFFREARIASQLTHPCIIPIFSINHDETGIFYTMPYIEGETLKQILRTALDEEKEGKIRHPIGSSIPSLMLIYLNVCQAIAYCHSKKILHRDLKPENIIVGKFNEVVILDWGLADFIEEDQAILVEKSPQTEKKDLTRPGKIAGTLSFLAPERVLGEPSSVLTDIYSLGVMLYQMLTLHLPFHRPSIQSFRKTLHSEKLMDPQEVAPYRDIPQHLSDIVKRCLDPDIKKRFQSVDDIISELKSYLEGRPEWIPAGTLNIAEKKDWEFQENIFLAKHIAIARTLDVMEWVSLMISRASFSGNTLMRTQVRLKEGGAGLGFLLAIPEAAERTGFEDGYCLWIGSETNPTCKLFRSNVEVMAISDVYLKKDTWHELSIEKVDNHVRLYLDSELKCHYISHIPMHGTHLGLLYRDADFELSELKISVGSLNAMVNCLAVPDAFLANKNYAKALSEYRRIGHSFLGRAEGREALFRAGVTILEEASASKKKSERERLYLLALDEFNKLRFTPGAPLEYLGKSLVYKASSDIEEEIKCWELTLRKYPKHPLIHIVIEHLTFRLHEASSQDRISAYQFALLVLRQVPLIFLAADNQQLLATLKENLEPLSFILPLSCKDSRSSHTHCNATLAIQLAFWLAKPITLVEIIETSNEPVTISNALFALLELGYPDWVKENLHYASVKEEAELIEIALMPIADALERFSLKENIPLSSSDFRCVLYLCDVCLRSKKSELLTSFFAKNFLWPKEHREEILSRQIWSLLLNNQWQAAHTLLETFTPEELLQERSPLYPLMGCSLWHEEGKEIALSHFSGAINSPFPRTSELLGNFLHERIDLKQGWISQAFPWEKIQLFRQLHLFYHCSRQPKKAEMFYNRMKREYQRVQAQYPHP
ncbi:MAG: serine/threonine-protein kinase PknD [Rhabdochlamydiaceae bacterium]|nr:serine/threonine-protein kinase PknD [Rhabdochlamydiaceae bacterium]